MSTHEKRSNFTGSLGFVLAAAGSAVGLGNIWRFPYLAAKYGGGIFLLVYLILMLTFGYALIVSETALGRMTRRSPVGAFGTFGKGGLFRFGGWINAVIPMLIVPYYSVIGGWIMKYIVSYACTMARPPDFTAFISSNEPVFWHFAFMAVTVAICYFGIQGIEKASKVMMPLLFVLLLVTIARSVTLPGASEGLAFMFAPNFSEFSLSSVSAAFSAAKSLYGTCLNPGVSGA